MSNSSAYASSSGIGFCGLLTILFIALKLTGYITWSWVWVLAPLWVGFALFLAIVFSIIVATLIHTIIHKR